MSRDFIRDTVRTGLLQNPEYCFFIVSSIDLGAFNVYTKDLNNAKSFSSAASLAAACWTISNQSQVRSMQHISCNPSNLFKIVTGTNARREPESIWGCGKLFTSSFHFVLILIKRLNCFHHHPRGSLKADKKTLQKPNCLARQYKTMMM